MNREQIKYAVKRVTDIESQLVKLVNRKDFETDAIIFDAEKRFKLFKQGKFKVTPSKGSNPFAPENRYDDFQNAVLVEGERKKSFNQEKYDAAILKIRQKANYIRDQLQLGIAEDALKLISEFENYNPTKLKGN